MSVRLRQPITAVLTSAWTCRLATSASVGGALSWWQKSSAKISTSARPFTRVLTTVLIPGAASAACVPMDSHSARTRRAAALTVSFSPSIIKLIYFRFSFLAAATVWSPLNISLIIGSFSTIFGTNFPHA